MKLECGDLVRVVRWRFIVDPAVLDEEIHNSDNGSTSTVLTEVMRLTFVMYPTVFYLTLPLKIIVTYRTTFNRGLPSSVFLLTAMNFSDCNAMQVFWARL